MSKTTTAKPINAGTVFFPESSKFTPCIIEKGEYSQKAFCLMMEGMTTKGELETIAIIAERDPMLELCESIVDVIEEEG